MGKNKQTLKPKYCIPKNGWPVSKLSWSNNVYFEVGAKQVLLK